ncbi:MAG: hypothetical protein P8Y71_12525 [Pseudolabrys sp.]|jgi:hypothetical protein
MTAETAASNRRSAFLFAHRANIDRYQRILETELTVGERRHFERCLAEEEAALERLSGISS